MTEERTKPKYGGADRSEATWERLGFLQWFKLVWPVFAVIIVGAGGWTSIKSSQASQETSLANLASEISDLKAEVKSINSSIGATNIEVAAVKGAVDSLKQTIFDVRTREEAKKGL